MATPTFKKYIFTFKEGTKEDSPEAKKAREFIKSQGGEITHDFGETGFAAKVPIDKAASASSLSASNDLQGAVEAVEEDGVVTTQ